MMLLVERELAAAVGRVRASRVAGPRPPAQVHDFRGRRKQDPPAPRAERGAEIDVLGVEEEPLVEQPDALGVASATPAGRRR